MDRGVIVQTWRTKAETSTVEFSKVSACFFSHSSIRVLIIKCQQVETDCTLFKKPTTLMSELPAVYMYCLFRKNQTLVFVSQ